MVFEYGIRYIEDNDIAHIANIEFQSFQYPWTTADFEVARKEPGVHILVALSEIKLIAYAVFDQDRNTVEIIKLAVAKAYQRKGVGTAILDQIKAKLWNPMELIAYTRESNLEGQLFLKKNGLKVTTIKQKFFEDDESGYRFSNAKD